MFEVGRYYRVKMWDNGDKCGAIVPYAPAKVVEVSPPLIKLKSSAFGGGGEVIVNTASLAFVSAELADG